MGVDQTSDAQLRILGISRHNLEIPDRRFASSGMTACFIPDVLSKNKNGGIAASVFYSSFATR
jgi:hypothetical protein